VGDWPACVDGGPVETAGAATGTSTGTTVTASGTANTKGSYAQLVASTARESAWLMVMLAGPGAAIDNLIDIAVGAAASEVVIASNLYSGGGDGTANQGSYYMLPISVPVATRIAARSQSSTVSNALEVALLLGSGSWKHTPPFGRLTTYGADTADSGGTQVDPGATAHTKGAYAQLVASSTNPVKALTLAIGNKLNSVRTNAVWLVDVAIGAAGSEQVIVSNIMLDCNASNDLVAPQVMGPIPVPEIPAGTRIAVRAQCSITDATDRLFDAIIYGLD